MPKFFSPGDRVRFNPPKPDTNGVLNEDGLPIGTEGKVIRLTGFFVDVEFPVMPIDPVSRKIDKAAPYRMEGDSHVYHMLPGELEAIQ